MAGLCQWMTPAWAAEELVGRYFPDLSPSDLVVEPSAGLGAMLAAIPGEVPAFGVEIDPELARLAEQNTGRKVIVGDFSMVALPGGVTTIIGNPPYHVPTIEKFIRRAGSILPENGRCGFLLPAYAMQTHQRVTRWNSHFAIAAELIPRRLFPRLRLPLVFVVFTRDTERKMVGLALYSQAVEMDRLAGWARKEATEGRPKRGVWRAVVEAALERLGGEASLAEIYDAISSRRPTENPWWREKVRQVLQIHFTNVEVGRWRLAA
ncbi:MAG: class I SAM-dependent methyltransferase [Mycobacteriales bacterium]